VGFKFAARKRGGGSVTRITRKEMMDLVPERNVKIVPGGQNDLFFQEWQREALFDFVQEIRRGRN
jgi:hypothetical protein